jgi:malate permease and related proteins
MLRMLFLTLVPVTVPIAIGYCWVRLGRPFDNGTLGQLASDVGMPCLIFSVLASADIAPDAFARTALAAFACLSLLALVGTIFLYFAGLRLRTYLPSVTWGNAGYLGIPLSLYAFGRAGLGYAVAFSAVSLVFNSIFSQMVAAGAARFELILRTPLVYAIVAGVSVAAIRMQLPPVVVQSVSLLGAIAVPLMLMMVGASLARIKAISVGCAMIFSLFRILAGATIGMLVAVGLGLSETARDVLVLQCAMPVAVLSYIFAQRWDNEPDEVASLVAVSTWSAAFSVPVMLSFMVR